MIAAVCADVQGTTCKVSKYSFSGYPNSDPIQSMGTGLKDSTFKPVPHAHQISVDYPPPGFLTCVDLFCNSINHNLQIFRPVENVRVIYKFCFQENAIGIQFG